MSFVADAINVTAPDGSEFIVEMWRPSWSEGMDFWDSLAYGLWSLVSPGWRINVKRFPVRGRAIHRERARTFPQARERAEVIAESLRHTGKVPPQS